MTYKVYDSGYRGDCRKEDAEQIDCMSWLAYQHSNVIAFHVVNESSMPVQGRVKARKKGLKKGVSDIVCLHDGVYGAFELKRKDKTKSRLSKEQKAHLVSVANAGGFAAVCYGFDEFKRAFSDYLKIK